MCQVAVHQSGERHLMVSHSTSPVSGKGGEAEADEEGEPPCFRQVPLGHACEGEDSEDGRGRIRTYRRVSQWRMQWVPGKAPYEVRKSHGRSLPRFPEAMRRCSREKRPDGELPSGRS